MSHTSMHYNVYRKLVKRLHFACKYCPDSLVTEKSQSVLQCASVGMCVIIIVNTEQKFDRSENRIRKYI